MAEIKYILYARKSTEGDDKQAQSLEDQMEVMQKIATDRGLKIVKVFLEAKSAKAPNKRLQFNKMIEMINKRQANGIICWQINRLSRNPTENGLIQQMLQDEKILRIQTHDRMYESDDNAVIFGVESSISNQFIRDLRKNVKRGIAKKISDGGISGPAPQGYKNNKEDKTIEVDALRFPIIKKAFHLYLDGFSVQQITRILNDDFGYTTPKKKRSGGKPMGATTLYHVLSNPRYAGVIPNPYDETKPGIAKYPPMITKEEYDKVQRLLGKKGKPRLCESRSFALKGLIRCGECGCMITAETKTKTLKDNTINTYTYYHCTRKKPCTQRGSIREEDLFKETDELLGRYELTPKLYEWGMEALKEIAREEIKARDDVQAIQYVGIQEIQTRLDNLLDMASRGYISGDEYAAMTKPLKNELMARRDEQAESFERARNWYEFVGNTIDELTHANERFANGELADKRRILLAIGENPILVDGKLSINTYEWLRPIEIYLEDEKRSPEKVITNLQQIGSEHNTDKISKWYPELGSNQRP